MKYFVEDTPMGFRFGWEGRTIRTYVDADGSHSPVAELYSLAERLWNSNPLGTSKTITARDLPSGTREQLIGLVYRRISGLGSPASQDLIKAVLVAIEDRIALPPWSDD